MSINTDPIFTNIGLNKIASAISTGSNIQLTTIKVGDCINDLNYQPTPLDTDIQHFIADTIIESTHYLNLKDSHHAVLRVRGLIPSALAQNYTIREYGVYDSNNDLIIIGRIEDTQLRVADSMKTELEIVINVSISDAQRAFIVNNVPDSEYVSKQELLDHIEAINPHGLTKEEMLLDRVTNTSDLDKPTHPYVAKLFHDTKLGVGFANRNTSIISKNNNIITLTPVDETIVYSRGVKYIISNPVSIDTSIRPNGDMGVPYPNGYIGGFYVAYNPVTNNLFIIDGNPDFDNDILVAWFYRNSTQGIIWLGEERHAASRNTDNHRLHHLEVGATWLDGGLLIATLGDATNNKLSISSPILIADEDLNHTILDVAAPVNNFEQKLTNAKLPVMWLGPNQEYRVTNNNNENINWLYNGSGAVYNNTALGTLVTVPSGKYLSYWLLFTNDIVEPVKLLVGRMIHDTIDSAGAEVLESFGLPMPEIVGAYKIILNIDNANNNLAKSKIQSVFEISNSTRKSSIKANSHTLLLGRNEPGQHTVNSIKGLEEALANAGKVKKVGLTGTVKADITEVDNNGKITLDTYMSDGRQMVYRDDPVFVDTIGVSYDSTMVKWIGITLAPNGKLYSPPAGASVCLEIDPVTKTTTSIGSTFGLGSWKYRGSCLAQNGMIYCPPAADRRVLKIDPVLKTTTLIGSDYGTSVNKWFDGVLGEDGYIYCLPADARKVLRINPTNDTTAEIGSDLGDWWHKWSRGCLAPNGSIYCAPAGAQRVLKIVPSTLQTLAIGSIYPETDGRYATKWGAAVLGRDGHIYCAPALSNRILKINTNTDTTQYVGPILDDSSDKFAGGVLGPNGKIYFIPMQETRILEFNPETLSHRFIELGQIANGYELACLAPNGKIYCAPRMAAKYLEIDIFPKSTDFQSYLKLPK